MRTAAHSDLPAPSTTLGVAAARFWWAIASCVLVFAGAGVAVATQLDPTYTAASQLSVGTVDAQTQAIPGYVEAAKTLAATYSRMATTAAVLEPASRRTGISVAALRERVSATPVIGSPIVSVKATGARRPQAIRNSVAVARALVAAVRETSRDVQDPDGKLLTAYRQSSERAIRAEGRLDDLRARQRRKERSVNDAALRRAQLTAETRRLQASAAAQVYTSARQRTTSAAGLAILERPVSASSDRGSSLQKLGFLGAVTGLVSGLGLAAGLDRRRRARAAPP